MYKILLVELLIWIGSKLQDWLVFKELRRFAFYAREVIRDKIIGEKWNFTIYFMISGRRYFSIEVGKQDVAATLIISGMAKAQDKRQGAEPLHDALIAAQDES